MEKPVVDFHSAYFFGIPLGGKEFGMATKEIVGRTTELFIYKPTRQRWRSELSLFQLSLRALFTDILSFHVLVESNRCVWPKRQCTTLTKLRPRGNPLTWASLTFTSTSTQTTTRTGLLVSLRPIRRYLHAIPNGRNRTLLTGVLQVVINSPIYKELPYQKPSETFHNWNDSAYLYGLNFASLADASQFAETMVGCIAALNECR